MTPTARDRRLLTTRLLPALLTVAATLTAFAQDRDSKPFDPALNFHKWGAVTIFNGMPSDNVRAIAQTADGMIWFGTDNGLVKFDGRRVQIVPLDRAVRVTSLESASDGGLWIGTDNGVFRFTDGSPRAIEPTRGYTITDVLVDKIVYLLTDEGIILTYDNGLMQQIPAAPLVNAEGRPVRLNSIARIGAQVFVATEGNGIYELNGDRLVELRGQSRPSFVGAILGTAGGVFVGATARRDGQGLSFGSDPASQQELAVATGSVSALTATTDGVIWAATDRNGIYRFDAERKADHMSFESTAGGLRSNTVFTLFTDREGVIWAGTDRGACRYDPASPTVIRFSDDPNSNFVRDLLPWQNGGVYVATNKGIYFVIGRNVTEESRWNGKQVYGLNWFEIPGLIASTPSGVFEVNSGRQVLKGDTRSVVLFGNSIIAATIDRGLVADDPDLKLPAIDSPVSFLRRGDSLWIGTVHQGVFNFDGNSLKPADQFAELRGTVVRKIVVGENDKIYFACENGLYVYENGGLTRLLTDVVVREVVTNENDVWAATVGNGLIHIRDDKDLGRLFAKLGTENGIPSDQTFAVDLVNGKVVVGTSRGLATYEPRNLPPSIVVSRVLSQRLHTAVEIGSTIELDYPQNSLLVEVAGLSSRTFPDQFQYAFALKDDTGRIIDRRLTTDPQFAPANLGAGTYMIEARAIGRDLRASDPIIVRFTVARAPFPLTATALALLLTVALVGLGWALIERRRLSVRNRELRAARFDLASEAERERSRIARDLHDQTLADLRKLMLMSDTLPADTHDLRSEIENVSTEIRRICEDLSPSLLQNVGLSAALEFLLHGAEPRFEFRSDPDLEAKCGFEPNVQMQIYRIAQEIVSNIRQHSTAESIEMKVGVADGEFELVVRDRGQAYDPDGGRKDGRGIANIRARAELIDANVDWHREGDENIFRLTKPVTVDIHDNAS